MDELKQHLRQSLDHIRKHEEEDKQRFLDPPKSTLTSLQRLVPCEWEDRRLGVRSGSESPETWR